MLELTIGRQGELIFPHNIRARYGLAPDTPVRVVEVQSGIFIVPLHGPMTPELEQELAEWQSLSVSAWDMYPYQSN